MQSRFPRGRRASWSEAALGAVIETSARTDGKQGVAVDRNQIETRWMELTKRLKAAGAKFYDAIGAQWLAKLRLKDCYHGKGAKP